MAVIAGVVRGKMVMALALRAVTIVTGEAGCAADATMVKVDSIPRRCDMAIVAGVCSRRVIA